MLRQVRRFAACRTRFSRAKFERLLSAHIETGTPMRVNMTVAPDRTFDFQILSPPTSHLILKSLNVPKGAPKPTETVGSLSLKHVYEIAKIKKADQGMETVPLESVARSVVAQARNMGVKVVP